MIKMIRFFFCKTSNVNNFPQRQQKSLKFQISRQQQKILFSNNHFQAGIPVPIPIPDRDSNEDHKTNERICTRIGPEHLTIIYKKSFDNF